MKPAVLMAHPRHFAITGGANPHTRNKDKSLKEVDPTVALEQWNTYVDQLLECGLDVYVIDATPEARRKDLVFLQNGMLQPFLDARGLGDNTQALVYFAVAKLGEAPTDGITDVNPEGLTAANGVHAEALAARLRAANLSCHVKADEPFRASMFEKLIWICSFMAVGAAHPGATVGDVESEHRDEVVALIDELLKGSAAEFGVAFEAGATERLLAYARAVAHFPTAVKELEWRNGFFLDASASAVGEGREDPFPTHSALLKAVGAA